MQVRPQRRDSEASGIDNDGADNQQTLPHGTADQVRAEVRERCTVLGRDGGYILAPAHTIQNDTLTENILAMYRAPRDAR